LGRKSTSSTKGLLPLQRPTLEGKKRKITLGKKGRQYPNIRGFLYWATVSLYGEVFREKAYLPWGAGTSRVNAGSLSP